MINETPKESAKKLAVHERRKAVLTLRRKGLDLRDIAATLAAEFGIKASHETVRKDLQAVLSELAASEIAEAKELRQLELVRLDGLFEALAPAVDAGDVAAVNACLRVAESRRKLLGLDAPQKIAPTTPDGEKEYAGLSDDERVARIAAILDAARTRRDRQSSTVVGADK